MIGEKIKKKREENNLTISELADKAGVAKSYISQIERHHKTNPSIQYLHKICKVLGISVVELIGEEEELN